MLTSFILAGLVKCQNLLIGDDPWPYAEYSVNELIYYCQDNCPQAIEKELVFRLRANMLNEEDVLKIKILLRKPWGVSNAD